MRVMCWRVRTQSPWAVEARLSIYLSIYPVGQLRRSSRNPPGQTTKQIPSWAMAPRYVFRLVCHADTVGIIGQSKRGEPMLNSSTPNPGTKLTRAGVVVLLAAGGMFAL